MSQATHSYIGRDPACNCIVAATVDNPDHPKRVAKEVAKFIRQGLAVERVEHEVVRQYFGCEHRKAKRQAKQAAPVTMEMTL
jgi:Ethanolamine utilization protein EutJ (predicted chaperonin)